MSLHGNPHIVMPRSSPNTFPENSRHKSQTRGPLYAVHEQHPSTHQPFHAAQSSDVVAFQGERGAFAQLAIASAWQKEVTLLARRSFEEVLETVRDGSATFGILPTINLTAGAVPGVHEQIAHDSIEIVHEVTIAVKHALLGVAGSTLSDIHEARSHPMAIMQCQRFFAVNSAIRAVEAYDTAGAARDLAASGKPWQAAIAGAWCAELYGLSILAPDIQDRPDNTTKFAIIALRSAR